MTYPKHCSDSFQVRCDAASLGVPCTNCVAFSIECKIPTPKRKKTAGKKDNDRWERGDSRRDHTCADDVDTATAPSRPTIRVRQPPAAMPFLHAGARC